MYVKKQEFCRQFSSLKKQRIVYVRSQVQNCFMKISMRALIVDHYGVGECVMIRLDEILDDETRRKVYEYNICLLGVNTHSEMQIWMYIMLVAGQLEYLATADLLLHKGKDPKDTDFWKSEELTTLGGAAKKLDSKKLFPSEIIENMKAIARLRNSVAHKNLLRGITLFAVYKERNVFQDKDAFEQLMEEASAVVKALHDWLRQHNPYADAAPCQGI